MSGRRPRFSLSAGLVAGTLLWAAPALGAPTTRELRASETSTVVSYDAPEDCPSVDQYLTEVAERLGPTWQNALGEFARRVEVRVDHQGERYLANVQFLSASGEPPRRSVSGKVCSEVVDGMALVTALAVQSRLEPPAPDRATVGASSAPIESTGASIPSSGVRMGAQGRAKKTLRPPAALVSAQPGIHFRLGARVASVTGVGPALAWGVGAFSGLEWRRARFGFSLDRVDSGSRLVNGVGARFRLLSARLEGCPFALEFRQWGALEPCGFGELGSFRAEAEVGPRVVTPEPTAITWSALGILGRWIARVGPLVAELELMGRAPLRRERFFVESEEQVVFRIPAITGGALIGLGLEF